MGIKKDVSIVAVIGAGAGGALVREPMPLEVTEEAHVFDEALPAGLPPPGWSDRADITASDHADSADSSLVRFVLTSWCFAS